MFWTERWLELHTEVNWDCNTKCILKMPHNWSLWLSFGFGPQREKVWPAVGSVYFVVDYTLYTLTSFISYLILRCRLKSARRPTVASCQCFWQSQDVVLNESSLPIYRYFCIYLEVLYSDNTDTCSLFLSVCCSLPDTHVHTHLHQ